MTEALADAGQPVLDPRRGPARARPRRAGPRQVAALARPAARAGRVHERRHRGQRARRPRRSRRPPSGAACRGWSRRRRSSTRRCGARSRALGARGWTIASSHGAPSRSGVVAVARGQPRARHARSGVDRRGPRRRRAGPRRRRPGRRQARPRDDRTPTRSRSRRHKIGGPQGVGALALADRPTACRSSTAGHQERGRRPGTENTLGIVGFGAAAAAVDLARVAGASPRSASALEAGLVAIPGARIHGADRPRIGGTINAGFAGARGESIVIALDLAGIAVSTGAACTCGSVEPRRCCSASAWPPEQAREAVRFSLGPHDHRRPRSTRSSRVLAGDRRPRPPAPVMPRRYTARG